MRHAPALWVVGMLLPLAGCASAGREAYDATRLAPGSAEEFARQFVRAVTDADTDRAMQLFISRDEFEKHLEGDERDYRRREQQDRQAVRHLIGWLADGSYVSLYTRTKEPRTIQPGGEETPAVKVPTPSFDQARVWVKSSGRLHEVYLGVLLKVDGTWRFIDPPHIPGR